MARELTSPGGKPSRRPADYWARIRDTWRHRGLMGLGWRIVVKCVSPLGSLLLANLYERDLTQPIAPVRAKVEVTLAQATPADADALAVLTARADGLGSDRIPSVADEITRRFERGNLCFVARIGPQIVHYNWVSLGWQNSLAGRFIVLPDDAAYCGGASTDEAWRGKAIHPAVHAMILRHLQTKGFRRAYTFAPFDNRPAWITVERMGWARSGVMMAFTPRWQARTRIWRVRGRLEPFVEVELPTVA